VEVDDDAGTGTCRSYFTVFQQVEDLALQPIIAGRYHDRFVRDASAWRFAERRFFIDLVGDLGRHLLIELPGTTDRGPYGSVRGQRCSLDRRDRISLRFGPQRHRTSVAVPGNEGEDRCDDWTTPSPR
jgi:hypothetical protein